MRTAKRIDELPPYLFASLDRKIEEARSRGIDVISLAIGDPDLPTPLHIVEAAVEGLRDPATHRYPNYYGMAEFRQAIAGYYQRRFGVTLDPDSQVLPLIGSKEGIAHLPIAFVDPGDGVLVSDPGYPVYEAAGMLMGGKTVPVALDPDAGWAPNLAAVADEEVANSKLLWLNYPNNPTAATCDLSLLEGAVRFSKTHDLL
ncbi:MAG: aminotransferase class I/II-fold pyridoxal phosphate-dependent enzyme, partial [Acidimicrobiia bacterium]